jgi:hypothetical protein
LAHLLRFSDSYNYKLDSPPIAIPAVLKTGRGKVELLANIYTGAADCLFEHGYAEALGLRVEAGILKTYATVTGGRFEAYGHEVSIEVLGIEVAATVYFYANTGMKRNVLGRRGWLDRIRLGLIDYDQMVYVSAYDSD